MVILMTGLWMILMLYEDLKDIRWMNRGRFMCFVYDRELSMGRRNQGSQRPLPGRCESIVPSSPMESHISHALQYLTLSERRLSRSST